MKLKAEFLSILEIIARKLMMCNCTQESGSQHATCYKGNHLKQK